MALLVNGPIETILRSSKDIVCGQGLSLISPTLNRRYRMMLSNKQFCHLANSFSSTSILGYNFSAPFFISPWARAGLANPAAEVGLIEATYHGNILYMPALYATLTIEQIAAAKPNNATQVTFQQVGFSVNYEWMVLTYAVGLPWYERDSNESYLRESWKGWLESNHLHGWLRSRWK